MQKSVYYCPKCDRTVSRERLEEIEADLVEKYGRSCLATMRCPVCDTDFIDLGSVPPGGDQHVGEARRIGKG